MNIILSNVVYHRDLFSDQYFLTFLMWLLLNCRWYRYCFLHWWQHILFCTSNIQDDVKVDVKAASIKVFWWFYNNGMSFNIDKCHFLSSLDIASTMTIENFTIQNSDSQKLLGIQIEIFKLMKTYFMSQFGYCPLVWMNHSRSLNNRINTLHNRTLRLVYDDFTSSFYRTIEKDNSVTVHQKILQN